MQLLRARRFWECKDPHHYRLRVQQRRNLGLYLPVVCDLSQAISAHKEEDEEEALGVAARLCEVHGLSAFDSLNNGTECHIHQGPDGQTHLRGQTEVLEDGNVRVRPIVAKPFWSSDQLQQAVSASI